MHKFKFLSISVILGILLFTGITFVAFARPLMAVAPGLGVADSFAVLGASTVTNTGSSVVNGDVGVRPGLAITGFPPGIIVPPGALHAGDAVALLAQNNVTVAYNALTSQPCDFYLTGIDLGGLTLTPGVYCFNTSAQLTGNLRLNAEGDPNAVWIFKIGSSLTTASGSSVTFTNSGPGPGCNVFWQVSSSATIGTNTRFVGNILALTSITLNNSADLAGRALARNGAVTLDNNVITPVVCASPPTLPPPFTQTSIAKTMTIVGPTLTAIAKTPSPTIPPPTQTAIAATKTAIAATKTVIAPTLTVVARTKIPTLTAQAATLTATAMTRLPTRRPPTEYPPSFPETGFSPQHITVLSLQPAEKTYADLGDLWLEIPRLGVKTSIVGVPQINGSWDVSWLGNNAGWLNNSAFPTWKGNSVITGHVNDTFGKPGPFVGLNGMWWGDKVIVHAWGAQYIYEVRSVQWVSPTNMAAMMKHEDLSWVTLVTCSGYEEASNSYKYRVVVRAVLVEVK